MYQITCWWVGEENQRLVVNNQSSGNWAVALQDPPLTSLSKYGLFYVMSDSVAASVDEGGVIEIVYIVDNLLPQRSGALSKTSHEDIEDGEGVTVTKRVAIKIWKHVKSNITATYLPRNLQR